MVKRRSVIYAARAISLLAFMFFPVDFTSIWREMEAIASEPRFKDAQASSLERANIERVKLGLEPMTI